MSEQTLPSEPRPHSSVTHWDQETDVLVIGYGGAGDVAAHHLPDGKTVPGLYAAGRTTCGISRSADGYASGTCIADATYFGRLAGRSVAAADAITE